MSAPQLANLAILIVEDDAEIARMVAIVLESAGAAVTTAADGACALTNWKSGQHDLVVVDWNLPDLRGDELLQRLRTSRRGPMMVITGEPIHPAKPHPAQSAGYPVLAKPFRPAELLNAIVELVSSYGHGTP